MKPPAINARVLVQVEDGQPIEVGTLDFAVDTVLTGSTVTVAPTGDLKARLANGFDSIAAALRAMD